MPDFDAKEDLMNMLGEQAEELYRVRNILPNAEGLIEAPVLPLRDMIVFPHMVSPLFVGREQSLWAILESQSVNQTVIALTQKDSAEQYPGPNDFLPIGVEMAVGDLLELPDGSRSALVQARRRVEIIEFSRSDIYLQVFFTGNFGK
ncbi:MAG: hypothetical protein B6243_01995 [Anaerolineaceae bacterium 4572_5.2]|nr:MAG: hypothetical protein B6243_01995 [Anaerolineaceae bacterium 4572_5.2]